MRRIYFVTILVWLLFAFICAPSPLSAAESPAKKPVRFQVLNTFKTDLPGIQKAQFIQFEMDPGAEVKNFKVVSEVLWVTQGKFIYVYGGKTVERKKGDRWSHNAGTVINVSNKDSEVAVLQGVQFIRAKK